MHSSTSSTMDTWEWGRVRRNSRRSSTSFSPLPSLLEPGSASTRILIKLLLLCLRIVDGDDACFAHAHRRASPTPDAAASEDVACWVQDATDRAFLRSGKRISSRAIGTFKT